MNKSQKAERKRREEYYECMRQEQIKKEEALERSLDKVDRVFKFLNIEDSEVLKAISKKISPKQLTEVLECWLEGNMNEEKIGKEFLELISSSFSSSDLFKVFENMKWHDQEDFQESFVDHLESKDLLTFKADSLEKVIAFEKFTEEWKNK